MCIVVPAQLRACREDVPQVVHSLYDESTSVPTIVRIDEAPGDAVVDVIVESREHVPRGTVDGIHHGKHPLDAMYRLLPFIVRSRTTTTTIAHRSRGWDLIPPLQPRAQDPVVLVLIRPQD